MHVYVYRIVPRIYTCTDSNARATPIPDSNELFVSFAVNAPTPARAHICMIYCIQHYLFAFFTFYFLISFPMRLHKFVAPQRRRRRWRRRDFAMQLFHLIFFRFFYQFFGVIFLFIPRLSPSQPIIFWCEMKYPLKKLRQNQQQVHKNKESERDEALQLPPTVEPTLHLSTLLLLLFTIHVTWQKKKLFIFGYYLLREREFRPVLALQCIRMANFHCSFFSSRSSHM